jgi:hypothetical protein
VAQKRDNTKASNCPKKRLTVLLCCSGAREKSKPLVTGNASQCRVFKEHMNTAHPPVRLRSNKRARLSRELSEEWLTGFSHIMKKGKQKILLFVDNATSHCGTKIMIKITVKFLPAHLSSDVHPLDQAILRAVKINLS